MFRRRPNENSKKRAIKFLTSRVDHMGTVTVVKNKIKTKAF